MTKIASTPKTPYYAVIFTSVLKGNDPEYAITAIQMLDLAKEQEGFLGVDSSRTEIGITVSYWRDLESIEKWSRNAIHRRAKERGKKEWYECYKTRISKVVKEY